MPEAIPEPQKSLTRGQEPLDLGTVLTGRLTVVMAAEAALEANGIETFLSAGNTRGLGPLNPVTGADPDAALLVRAADLERARQALAEET